MQCGPVGLVCEEGQEVRSERWHLGARMAFALGRKDTWMAYVEESQYLGHQKAEETGRSKACSSWLGSSLSYVDTGPAMSSTDEHVLSGNSSSETGNACEQASKQNQDNLPQHLEPRGPQKSCRGTTDGKQAMAALTHRGFVGRGCGPHMGSGSSKDPSLIKDGGLCSPF